MRGMIPSKYFFPFGAALGFSVVTLDQVSATRNFKTCCKASMG